MLFSDHFSKQIAKTEGNCLNPETILNQLVGKTKLEYCINMVKSWSNLKLQQNCKKKIRYSTNDFFN